MSQTLTLDECAAQLGTSRNFVDTMVAKGRLHPNANGKVPANELEAFSELLNKLRGGGIAAMVDAVDNDL
ncbi:hypothetical protein [Gilvimarinus agarilyticus]|uniref:hypothetical protein n=1 Tax=Gilvimarinus agarilyticus TaxID=679259 RepID=UPI0005A1F796|nr:hypothetical protein [Gilvimarinus agarilyticus]